MRTPSESDIAQAMNELRRLVRALYEGSKRSDSRFGVTGAQLFVLRAVARAGSAASIGSLAEATATHQTTISESIAKLEKAGLVRSVADPEDRRARRVELTAEGRKIARSRSRTPQEELLEALRSMREADASAFVGLLRELNQRAGFSAREPGLFMEGAERTGKRKKKAS